jgi:hypothetical protein
MTFHRATLSAHWLLIMAALLLVATAAPVVVITIPV